MRMPNWSLSSELGNAKTQPQERAHSCHSSRSAGSKRLSELGRPDARELAITLMSSDEGAALLTNTLRDPKLMTTESRRLERWIDSLS
jgi:hypothetical protein